MGIIYNKTDGTVGSDNREKINELEKAFLSCKEIESYCGIVNKKYGNETVERNNSIRMKLAEVQLLFIGHSLESTIDNIYQDIDSAIIDQCTSAKEEIQGSTNNIKIVLDAIRQELISLR